MGLLVKVNLSFLPFSSEPLFLPIINAGVQQITVNGTGNKISYQASASPEIPDGDANNNIYNLLNI